MQAAKLEEQNNIRSLKLKFLTSDMEPQDLIFALLGSGLISSMLLISQFEMVIYILCHYMFEVCDFKFMGRGLKL